MDSLGSHCTPLKRAYEHCFNQWFTQDFLKALPDKDRQDPCEEVFNEYKACVMIAIKEKKLDKLIEEARRKVDGRPIEVPDGKSAGTADAPPAGK